MFQERQTVWYGIIEEIWVGKTELGSFSQAPSRKSNWEQAVVWQICHKTHDTVKDATVTAFHER